MKNTWAICKREFLSFFTTPIGYVVVGVFALISGLAFVLSLMTYSKMSIEPAAYGYTSVPSFGETFLSPYLVFNGILIMFLSPLMTMRLLANSFRAAPGMAESAWRFPTASSMSSSTASFRPWACAFSSAAAAALS